MDKQKAKIKKIMLEVTDLFDSHGLETYEIVEVLVNLTACQFVAGLHTTRARNKAMELFNEGVEEATGQILGGMSG